nr:MAG TPA: hypothetical protein [Caudoviricetes sp.]
MSNEKSLSVRIFSTNFFDGFIFFLIFGVVKSFPIRRQRYCILWNKTNISFIL